MEILRDDGVGPLRMTSVVPTALVRFFGPSLTLEALLRNKTRKSFAINNGGPDVNSHAEELSLWTCDEVSRQILRPDVQSAGL